jgi:transposase
VPLDPQQLPDDPQALRKMIVDLSAQLDRQAAEKLKIERMVRELLDAKRLQSSERLSPEQLALFEAMWQARQSESGGAATNAEDNTSGDDDQDPPAAGEPDKANKKSRGGRRPLAAHLERQRIVHDLAEADKHCAGCGETLRPIGEDTSERYEYVPASLTVVEDVCL